MSLPYLFVAGTPYSGSTLLSFLLDAHPDCVCLGEINGLTADVVPEEYRCSCGRPFLACEFWNGIAARMQELGSPIDLRCAEWVTEFRAFENRYLNHVCIGPLQSGALDTLRDLALAPLLALRGGLARGGLANAALARAALDATGASVFADATKSPQRIRFLARTPGLDLRVVHLVRDARGGVASYMKNASASVERAARQWVLRNRMADRARRYVPTGGWLVVRQSDLCDDVQGTMDRIADFARLRRAAVPAELRPREHHIVGNRMRLADRITVRSDDSWRDTLGEDGLRTVARICGPLNRSFGYAWPTQA